MKNKVKLTKRELNSAPTKTMDPVKSHLRPQVIKVTSHVYVAVGYALANVIMIEGK